MSRNAKIFWNALAGIIAVAVIVSAVLIGSALGALAGYLGGEQPVVQGDGGVDGVVGRHPVDGGLHLAAVGGRAALGGRVVAHVQAQEVAGGVDGSGRQGRPVEGRRRCTDHADGAGGGVEGQHAIAELQALDFARMDLTEFYASIVPTLPNAGALHGSNAARLTTCYYGQGKCQ